MRYLPKLLFGKKNIILGLIFVSYFLFSIRNIATNSPTYSEASFIVLGKLQIFQNDWFTYQTHTWLGLTSILYPALSAISSQIVGVAGVRFINILLGLAVIELVFIISQMIVKKTNVSLAITALVAFNPYMYYFATQGVYVMASLVAMLLSVYFMLHIKDDSWKSSKHYFFVSLSLLVGFLMRINFILYFVLIWGETLIIAHRTKSLKLFFLYFLIPTSAALAFILAKVPSWASLTFAQEIRMWEIAPDLFVPLVVASAAIVISLNKTLSKSFLPINSIFVIMCAGFMVFSFQFSKQFDTGWSDSKLAMDYLKNNLTSKDQLLAESGPVAMLSLYGQIDPRKISSFDWFEYKNKEGNQAYVDALRDGYFDFVEVQLEDVPDEHIQLLQDIDQNTKKNYNLVYSENSFQIWQRAF